MSKKDTPQSPQRETKERIPAWLYPTTLEAIDRAMEPANCKNRSEFLDCAARFYAGYISGEDALEFLPSALVSALRATIQNSESRTARLLFKLAVEIDMMMNVLAVGMEVPTEDLEKLRAQCVRNVKATNGSISYKEAQERQSSGQD